jgi:TolA-binding protein
LCTEVEVKVEVKKIEKRETKNTVVDKSIRYIKNNQTDLNGFNDGFEGDQMPTREDQVLFETISEYMVGQFDLEDVHNDAGFQSTQEVVKGMISDYNKNKSDNGKNEKFIREIFSGELSESILSDEIESIKQEINDNKLNEITADWVKEWHEKKQKTGLPDPKSAEIRDFITGAINTPQKEPVKRKSVFIRYTSMAAAAVIGAFILLRILLPSPGPDKLFSTYYKPFEALSTVTRSLSNNESDSYSAAIANYKLGDYQKAAKGFAGILEKYPSSVSASFFLGLSQISLGNYGQAENLLSAVVNGQGEYAKEARWYLGLTCLKTEDTQKAKECFTILAGSDGYYRERSEKILRRLK